MIRNELHALTGLRFIAATSVFVHHLVGVLWLPEGAVGTANLGMTVSLFFVLSGFVLAHANAERDPHRTPVAFFVQRFLRIWPAHAATFFFSLVLFWPTGTQWFRDNFTTLELLQILGLGQAWSSDPRIFWGVNAVAWSISVEALFYLLFPALLLLSKRSPALVVAVGAAASAIWLFVADASVVLDSPFEALGWGAISPVPRLAEFALGIAAHRLAQPLLARDRSEFAGRATAIEGAVTILACAAIMWSAPISDSLLDRGTIPHAWLRAAGSAPVFAVLIVALALGHGAVSHALSIPVMQWLGRISFAEYLVHQRLIVYWQRKIVPREWPVALEVISLIAAVVAMSAFIHRFIELPGVRLGRWLTRNSTQRRAKESTTGA